ncbi:uncharacterized protein LOC131852138 [Achroia grisella]|uniref:uncharacterized protein LOC131852138 n=1 Tax=Achroia grisella TaxID=688607 RepID=UPI0027D31F0A|nr:uncharacterized protein LOC131852138 [Achroia grisella]
MAKSRKKSKSAKPQTNKASPASTDDSINSNILVAALSVPSQPVLMKVCRLCGTKDGPFLNIFDPEQVTASKVDQLMPFKITENDDLPHKICFRCSAKVEELYEFVQKCINTQENLHKTMGKNAPVMKPKSRILWEEKLNKSNMSNDDICDALIKKAMEGIKDIPLKSPTLDEENVIPKVDPTVKKSVSSPNPTPKDEINSETSTDSKSDKALKQVNLKLDKCEQRLTRGLRSNNSEKLPSDSLNVEEKNLNDEQSNSFSDKVNERKSLDRLSKNKPNPASITSISIDCDDEEETANIKNQNETNNSVKSNPETQPIKAFNIMDHISMIKVNGVGVLFQCQLCNRNFLKKEVVMIHACAKNGVPKVDFTVKLPAPEPPKVSTVKYINTKVNNDLNKPIDLEVNTPLVTEKKSKPKIGPASKIRRERNDLNSSVPSTTETMNVPIKVNQSQLPIQTAAPVQNTLAPTINFPNMPSLQGRYKLMPGPNNTFTLVEDTSQIVLNNTQASESVTQPNKPISNLKKRKSDDANKTQSMQNSNMQSDKQDKSRAPVPNYSSTIIDLEDQPDVTKPTSNDQPYPVGLFQTVSRRTLAPPLQEPPAFTTPAMKKQSYTIVQTGNPSKLLISTKPQPAPVEEVPKKKSKKLKDRNEEVKEPFSVTLEDANHTKDSGFFTFINVDPLLQPSYVLPTDNIIQESQISTSTSVVKETAQTKEKEKYSCNMCSETFSREKKLLAHIQSHYSKMDEEDQLRAEKSISRKRGKRN